MEHVPCAAAAAPWTCPKGQGWVRGQNGAPVPHYRMITIKQLLACLGDPMLQVQYSSVIIFTRKDLLGKAFRGGPYATSFHLQGKNHRTYEAACTAGGQ